METAKRVEDLDRDQCLDLLWQVPVGRMAFVEAGDDPAARAPRVVAVAFVVDGGDVVVRTSRGSRLGSLPTGWPVTFEADDFRASSEEGWSVVVHGVLVPETDPDRLGRLSGRLDSWAPGVKDRWLRLPLTSVRGRRLVGTEMVVELPDSPRPRWREPSGWVPATRTPAQYATDFDGR